MVPLKWIPAALLCLFLLFGCAPQEAAPPPTETTACPTEDTRDQVEELAIVVTNFDISQLSYYSSLKTLDLSGSVCYPEIMEYCRMNPQVDVTYTVDLGGTAPDNRATSLELQKGSYQFESLLENLKYLPQVKSLSLPDVDLDREELTALEEAYPEISVSFTVVFQGVEYPGTTTELDLSHLTSDQVGSAANALGRMADLTFVQLMNGDRSNLTVSDVKTLVDAAPGVNFHYTFSLFGQTIATDDETVTFQKLKLTEEDVPALRAALGIMTGCNAFILDDCGLDYDRMAQIREEFPGTELVWRLNVGRRSILTNAQSLWAVGSFTDEECANLRYCRDMKYLDLGHNTELTDLSFVGQLPELKVLIASGSLVSDLSGFENCKKLEFLELAYCGKLSDLTPLAGCENLKNLNVSHTKVSDLSPLDGLPLERFFCVFTAVPGKEQKIFQELHADCWTHFYSNAEGYPYGIGWRYDDANHFSEIYAELREVFNYDAIDKLQGN